MEHNLHVKLFNQKKLFREEKYEDALKVSRFSFFVLPFFFLISLFHSFFIVRLPTARLMLNSAIMLHSSISSLDPLVFSFFLLSSLINVRRCLCFVGK